MAFRFTHVSTDEVYGTLGPDDAAFSEETAYAPNSPYAASKAGSDHLARAYFHTFKLPVLDNELLKQLRAISISGEINPFDDSECAGRQAAAGVWATGKNVRDWLFVEDHCADPIRVVLRKQGGWERRITSAEAMSGRISTWVMAICDIVDELRPLPPMRRRDAG